MRQSIRVSTGVFAVVAAGILGAVVLAVLAFELWFFSLSGSSLPSP